MSIGLAFIIALAGLSESLGRILPIVSRRPNIPFRLVVALMATGTAVEGTIIGAWPLAATTIADFINSASSSDPTAGGLAWTPGTVAPLLLCGVLAFPMIGPFLHALIFVGVGLGLVGSLSATSGLEWWTAAGCVAAAGTGLAVVVAAVRHLIARRIALTGRTEAVS